MKWDTKSPCGSCPYRKDAPLGLWHPAEFDNLLKQDGNEMQGAAFGCHATIKAENPSVCAGWLLDQKKRGIPSIQLRLHLMQNSEALQCLEEVNSGGHELYDSIREMVEANEELGRCDCGRYLQKDGTCPCA